ncbi:hypothetical protein F5888DRAFT_1739406, partial [Russula emetica]
FLVVVALFVSRYFSLSNDPGSWAVIVTADDAPSEGTYHVPFPATLHLYPSPLIPSPPPTTAFSMPLAWAVSRLMSLTTPRQHVSL